MGLYPFDKRSKSLSVRPFVVFVLFACFKIAAVRRGVGEERRKEEELGRDEKGFISPILLLRFGAVLPAPVVQVKPQTVSLRENKVITLGIM